MSDQKSGAAEATAVRPSFASATRHLSPAWFAAVMGTGVIPLALSFTTVAFARPLAAVFMVLALLMAVILLVPWLVRLFRYPEALRKDLRHPIAANFLPTMPIALIVLALDFLKYPDLLVPAALAHQLAFWLWAVGSLGIYLFGFVILLHVFPHDGIELGHANFGWYIPPVSKLIIPVAGLELAHLFPAWQDTLVVISLISFGVGFFLFLFVGAAVYHRYVYHELPPGQFAPTFFIGVAPTAVAAVALFKLLQLVRSQPVFGLDAAVLQSVLGLAILLLWGLSVWWWLMALLLILRYLKSGGIPFALSWWAFTFPSGALAVASGVAWKLCATDLVYGIYLAVLAFLLTIWTVVFLRTLGGVLSGKIFAPRH